MGPSPAADFAVLVAAVLTLVAIAAKLVTANLVSRARQRYEALDAQRRGVGLRLKDMAARRKSAEGTLEFWTRRRDEAQRQLTEMKTDLQEHAGLETEAGGVEAAAPEAPPPAEGTANAPAGVGAPSAAEPAAVAAPAARPAGAGQEAEAPAEDAVSSPPVT